MRLSKHHWERIAIVGILVAGILWQCIGAWSDSQTSDEAVHLAAGYSYWKTNDHRLNPEHPPLFKLLAATPLLGVHSLNFSTSSDKWQNSDEWGMGTDLLFGSTTNPMDAQLLLFGARMPLVLLWVGLGVLLWWWSRSMWGPLGGLLTLGLFTFDPNYLAHGHLITNDIGMCLTFVGTAYVLDRFLKAPSWKRAWIVGAVFGVAQIMKFSSVILWLLVPIIAIMHLIYRHGKMSWRWVGILALTILVATPLIGWTVYGFTTGKIETTPLIQNALTNRAHFDQDHADLLRQPPFVQKLYKLTTPGTVTASVINAFLNAPLPAQSYFSGLMDTANHDFWGHGSFLWGHSGTSGWWWYFPFADLVKTPTLTALLFLLTIGWAAWRLVRRYHWRIPLSFWTVVFPGVAFLAWAMTSHINIGIRHSFPFLIFVPLWAGSLATLPISKRIVGWSVATIIVTTGLVSLLAWPNELSYFAGWTGGTSVAYRYLLDSNFDWGQDIWRLHSYLAKHNIDSYHMAVFGYGPNPIFPGAESLLTDTDIQNGATPSGTVIMSVGTLYDPNGSYKWLRTYHPDTVVGSTIYIYHFN